MRPRLGDEQGQVLIEAVLWIMLVGIITVTSAITFGYLSTSSNWIEHVCQEAAKSGGTSGMTGQSLAQGQPIFDIPVVQQVATQVLAEDLGLDPSTLAPGTGSPFVTTPSVQVVVSNGPFPATITVPYSGATLTESYPTVVVAVQGPIHNWMGQTITGTYWAAARIYEPGAPP